MVSRIFGNQQDNASRPPKAKAMENQESQPRAPTDTPMARQSMLDNDRLVIGG
jgi:hypothetical protein